MPKKLTERRFRSYWDQTEGNNERQRFSEVQRLMAEDIILRAQDRPKIGKVPASTSRCGHSRPPRESKTAASKLIVVKRYGL